MKDEVVHSVMCPLVDREIEDIDCIVNRDITDNMLNERLMPNEFRINENWKDICRNCKWHDY